VTKPQSQAGWSVESQTALQTAAEHFRAGRYAQAANCLWEAQLASQQEGDAITALVLVLARCLCLACRRCQAAIRWHRSARQEAEQREQDLKRQLDALLGLIEWRETPEPPSAQPRPERASDAGPHRPGIRHGAGLWPRIQATLIEWVGHKEATCITERVSTGPAPAESILLELEPAIEALVPTGDRLLDRALITPHAPGSGPPREPIPAPFCAAEAGGRSQQPPHSLEICCLGPFRVYQDGQLTVEWQGLKCQAILKYLVAHRERPIAKDILMDVFWPEADHEAARRNLHQAIYSLRRTLRESQPGFPYIWFENDCYVFNPEACVWADFEEFELHVREGQRLAAAGQLRAAIEEWGIAEGLYQGDFLEEDLYEDWPSAYRDRLRARYLEITDQLSSYYARRGEHPIAIALCRKMLARDSCYEVAHCRLMRCFLAQGQRHLAVHQYQACVQTLKEELDLAPSAEMVALYHDIAGSGG
jgi:DNA-binding SARP family transcriptional activator